MFTNILRSWYNYIPGPLQQHFDATQKPPLWNLLTEQSWEQPISEPGHWVMHAIYGGSFWAPPAIKVMNFYD